MVSTKCLFFSVCLVMSLDLATGLKCYQCQLKDGSGDKGCDESPPPEKYLRDCAQPQCWTKHSDNGTTHIERFCVAVATNVNGCVAAIVIDNRGSRHTGMECRCNDSDGCNGNNPGGSGSSSSNTAQTTSGSTAAETETTSGSIVAETETTSGSSVAETETTSGSSITETTPDGPTGDPNSTPAA